VLIKTCEELMEKETYYSDKIILLVNDMAPLVMPGQTLVREMISGIVLDASVMVLHLMGADECFSQASISYRETV
jgi:hypothetical protein